MKNSGRVLTLALVALLALVAFSGYQPAVASYVVPIVIADNPSCEDLGYDFGFKPQPEPPPSGSYMFPDGYYTVDIVSDGVFFDWTSTLAVDAVIVKGGPNANVYVYDPPAESTGDTDLSSPINQNNGQPYAISHIDFCYDFEVDVEKDANTSFTRTYEWDITKDYDGTYSMFAGESTTHDYLVSVFQTGYTDSDWAVEGTITIENNTPFDATIEDVADEISGFGPVAADCGVTFPYVLPAWGSLSCSYASPLPDGADRVNTATVTTSGIVGGGLATADVIFGDPTTEVNAEINVEDTNGLFWTASGDDSWGYSKDFACSSNPADYVDGFYTYDHPNTATIQETGQSDGALVTVNCYAPVVSKDAYTSFTRTWDWTIDKVGDQSDLFLSLGQQFLVNYAVTVDATYTDSDWAVEGTITVENPNPDAAMTVSLVDIVSPDIVASLDCGGSLVVPAGGSATCGYSADLPDGSDRTNTATATLNGIGFSGSADVLFDAGNPTVEIDECIEVDDDRFGPLGTVCAADAPATFNYSLYVGPYDECGLYTFTNVASFVTNNTGTTGSDDWTVVITVPCAGGCTLTPGYWKTHSSYGPAPYDETWAQIGEDTPFFLSSQSYYEVLWTTPQGGNAYYILAHAYIAAELNELNGADFSAAQDAFDDATVLFQTYTPDEVAGMKGKTGKAIRDQFIALAEILDDYNNGLIGPGHCSE